MTKNLSHQVKLIQTRTADIRAEESKIEWDGKTLRVLYALRGQAIEEALKLGATEAYLAELV